MTDDFNVQSASDLTGPSDEDRLNFIARSLPPFSPSSDPIIEIATEIDSNPNMSLLQSNNGNPNCVVPSTGLDMDIDPCAHTLDAESKVIRNRKKDQSTDSSSVSKRQVLGEGNSQSFKGKAKYTSISASCSTSNSVDTQDLPSSSANMYDHNSSGPFDVIVQKTCDSANSANSSIDPLAVGRLLFFTNKNDILELKKTGYSKINIRFKTREATNKLTSNQILKAKGYHAYIPLYRTTRKSIIRGVPLDLTDGEILALSPQ